MGKWFFRSKLPFETLLKKIILKLKQAINKDVCASYRAIVQAIVLKTKEAITCVLIKIFLVLGGGVA